MPLVDGKLTGKYRALLIPFNTLKAEASILAPNLVRGSARDAEFAAEFIRLFAEHRTGKKWPQIPGLPGMIPKILRDWCEGRADLRLATKPVSAKTMLAAQASGWRFVTVDLEAAMAGEPVERDRDAFEFALHDLGHAYAFFKEDYNPQGQVHFFQLLSADLETLQPWAERDAKFAQDLEYGMSDMNSHPEHLRQYLQGVIVEMFLRERTAANQTDNEAELTSLLKKLRCLKGLARRHGDAIDKPDFLCD
ncbi:MAG: hypothetical protein J0L53_14800 [Spirochaetes bacterium]|nr:hypothetical protein [Spirochaetota bacterium]